MSGLRLLLPACLVAIGVLLLPLPALAGEGDEDEKAPKVKVKVKKLEEKAIGAPAKPRSPAETVHRWLAGEIEKWGGAAEGARTPLHAWFEAGNDVPLAGLRDALKKDGWTADQLVQWIQRQAARMSSMGSSGPRAFGRMRGWSGPGWFGVRPGGGWRRLRMRGPWGFGGRGDLFGGRGPFQGGAPWGNAWGGSGPFGGQGALPGWGGMFTGPSQQQSRTIILWNDGSGWQRREIPGGMGAGPWMGGMGGGPWGPMGAGPGTPPQPPQPPQSPDVDKIIEWLKQLKPEGSVQAPGAGPDAPEWIKRLPPDIRKALEGLQHGARPKVHVKTLRPREVEIIEEEVEVEPGK